MSKGTFGQARRTLEIVEEQKLEAEHIKTLHAGYLVDLARAIKSGTLPARETFQKFLGLLPELKVWKTITLGTHKTPVEYEKALESKGGFGIGDWARQILRKISVSPTEIEVDLCVMTVAELGFKDGARRDAIYARALELGLRLCPAEVGPALRLAYKDQPRGEWLRIAHEPIAGSDGFLLVFGVGGVSGDRWLHGLFGSPGRFWLAGNRWLFVAPRK